MLDAVFGTRLVSVCVKHNKRGNAKFDGDC